MKIKAAFALSISLAVLAGCSDGASEFKDQFIAGCLDSGSSQAYCSCALEKLEVQYSDAELSTFQNTGRLPKNFFKVMKTMKEVCLLQTN